MRPKDPRLRSKSLGRRESVDDNEKDDVKQSILSNPKPHFHPYGRIPPQSILKKPAPPAPIIIHTEPLVIQRTIILNAPASNAPRPIAPTQVQPLSAPPTTKEYDFYSDGNRIYLGPALPPVEKQPAIVAQPAPPVRHPPPPRPRPPPKKIDNPANYRIYPTNIGKTLLKKPSITKIGFNETSNGPTETPLPHSEPYNPIRPPAISLIPGTSFTSPPPMSISSNPTMPMSSGPPQAPTMKIFPKDDEIEAIKIVKHPILRHHRSGGGEDIRKIREMYVNKRGGIPNSSPTKTFSPGHEEHHHESERAMEIETVEQSQDTVAENDQSESQNVIDDNQMDTVIPACEEMESREFAGTNPNQADYNPHEISDLSVEEIANPNLPTEVEKEPQRPVVVAVEERSIRAPPSKRSKKSNREDGELSRSPSPEIITIDDSDDEIIILKDPSPKGRYKGQTALGLDLYLNNLGKNGPDSASEPLGMFFDMKLFYQDYQMILQRLIQENQERTNFAHGIIDRLCEIGASLEVYFLNSGDALEESRADEEFSEIQIYIASISDEKNVNVAALMEPVYNAIKDSDIGDVTFYPATNVIVIIQGENNIAIRPLDKLEWARSSLVAACGSQVTVFKEALLLIKKAMRQFCSSEILSDFVISFSLIHYFQQIKVFPSFDFDLDEIDVVGSLDPEVHQQPAKKSNEIFSEFLFFIKHNETLTIECPFTKEQLDSKETALLSTVESILGH